ncbi:Os01g0286550, partial [Oryza sativa Japonica Group]
MLPPGRARASVTSTSPTPCFVASACAVQSPLMPPPTTTQSADTRAPGAAGASAAPLATAQRTWPRRRVLLAASRMRSGGAAVAEVAVAMAAAAAAMSVADERLRDAERRGDWRGVDTMRVRVRWLVGWLDSEWPTGMGRGWN